MGEAPVQNERLVRPDYAGGSIVNLMESIAQSRGHPAPAPTQTTSYPPLRSGYVDPAALSEPTNLVLLVLDGVGYHSLRSSAVCPYLARYAASQPLTSVFPSATAPALTTFLTGLAPLEHGVTGWTMYLHELGVVTHILPFSARFGGPVLTTFGIESAAIFDQRPIFDRIDSRCYALLPAAIAASSINSVYASHAQRYGYSTVENLFRTIALVAKSSRERKFLYCYLPDFDLTAHRHGVASDTSLAVLATIDAWFGRLLNEVDTTDCTLLVTADHGLVDSLPEDKVWLDDHPALAETLALPLCGEERAAYCYVRPGCEQQLKEYVSGPLQDRFLVMDSAAAVQDGYFGRTNGDGEGGQVHPQLRRRIGDLCLLGRGTATLHDRMLGETYKTHIGFHGGISAEEMQVPLVVARTGR